MVSLFPSPADVKAGVVDYVMNPTNVGYVTIAVVVLVVPFNLGGCVSLAPLAQSGKSPDLRPPVTIMMSVTPAFTRHWIG